MGTRRLRLGLAGVLIASGLWSTAGSAAPSPQRGAPRRPRRKERADARRVAPGDGPDPAAHLRGSLRRRRARHGAHRRPQDPGGAPGPDRLYRGHQHGRRGRRTVRERHDRRRHRIHHALGRLAGGVPRCAAAPGSGLPAQTGRPELPGAPAARTAASPHPSPEGIHSRAKTPGDPAPADSAVQQQHEFRSAADAVSRRGHGPGEWRGGASRPRGFVGRHAGQHLRSRRFRSGRLSRTTAGRRRPGGESAHRCGAGHGRGHSDRLRRELPAAAARATRLAAVHLESDAGDSGTQGLRPAKRKPSDRRIF